MTSAAREAALADFENALGKYPKAAEYLDEQRAVERRNAARLPESPAPSPRAPATRQEQRRSAGALIGRKRRPNDRLASLTGDELAAYVTEPLRHPIELRPPAPELDLL